MVAPSGIVSILTEGIDGPGVVSAKARNEEKVANETMNRKIARAPGLPHVSCLIERRSSRPRTKYRFFNVNRNRTPHCRCRTTKCDTNQHYSSNIVVRQRSGQLSMGSGLRDERIGFRLKRLHSIGAGSETGRRRVE